MVEISLKLRELLGLDAVSRTDGQADRLLEALEVILIQNIYFFMYNKLVIPPGKCIKTKCIAFVANYDVWKATRAA